MNAKKPIKRIYLINRDFQVKYVKLSVLVGLGSTLLTIFLLLFPLVYFGIIRFPGFLPPMFMWAIGFAALVNFVLVGMGTILMTHRIAGPMFSLVRQMRTVQGGLWNCQMTTRKNDDMQFVIRNFNDLTDSLTESCQNDLRQLDGTLEALEAGESPDSIKKMIAEHRGTVESLISKGE